MTKHPRQVFYRGFLLALRARTDGFMSYGDGFHEAFEETLSVAYLAEAMPFSHLIEEMLEDKDPMFGVYHAAGEMIMEGIGAFLLTLDAPGYMIARFSISKSQAAKELAAFEHADVYAAMAKTFHEYAGEVA